MDDDLNLELDENNNENITRINKRINTLADKVKEKDEALTKEAEARKKAEEEKANAAIERDFYKGFNTFTTKYQNANEYQDKVLEKVKAGYEIEDAVISILAKEGKLTTPPTERETVAGGSASTNIKDGTKSIDDMSKEEKRAALMEAETRGEFRL